MAADPAHKNERELHQREASPGEDGDAACCARDIDDSGPHRPELGRMPQFANQVVVQISFFAKGSLAPQAARGSMIRTESAGETRGLANHHLIV
ncbi:MAG: hypothetical protein KJ947_20850 [Alphaproteobacteria bacterium]|nr:hypothetical protein [Alphaproteobacteria bacterium]MBU1551997.1 hypothetical protein [Alphaproteobacteria bacterium]MBU2337544.1 hypothetical protein [Alphaproteobacteria bacterium]MBU2388185.1 hypothetical protein [Alphaproteobacteria bacterium]